MNVDPNEVSVPDEKFVTLVVHVTLRVPTAADPEDLYLDFPPPGPRVLSLDNESCLTDAVVSYETVDYVRE